MTCGSASSTTATTPWCWPWPASASRRAPSTGCTATFAASARATRSRSRASCRPGEHVQRVHGIGALAQARGDRVEAEQGASGGHRKVIAAGGSAATEAANRCGSVTRATLVPTRQTARRSRCSTKTCSNCIRAILLVVGAILPIVNPVGSAPMFLAMTHGADSKTRGDACRRWSRSIRSCCCLGSLIFGNFVLQPVRPVGAGRAARRRRSCSARWAGTC